MNLRDQMWNWVPEIYRIRDAESGGALKAIVEVIAEQAERIEGDIRQLYDNWFIETCEDWVVPYIGELIGADAVGANEPPIAGREAALLGRVRSPRREVANAIRDRRRKGSFALLEDLATDVTGWPAQIVEASANLASTPSVKHLRSAGPVTVDVRDRARLARLGSPEDQLARSTSIGGVSGARFGLNSLAVFVARVDGFPVTRSDAFCIDEDGSRCFTFDALGRDVPLFGLWRPRDGRRSSILPARITRAMFAAPESGDPPLYGEGASLMIWRQPHAQAPFEPVPRERIVAGDLAGWRLRPAQGTVAVDPERGRIAFPERESPERVLVSYRYGIGAAIGGGEYPRPVSPAHPANLYRIGRSREAHDSLQGALAQWYHDDAERAVIEFTDSHVYDEEKIHIELREGRHLQIRAMSGARPVIRLANYNAGAQDALRVTGAAGTALVLDGVTVAGRGIVVRGQLGELGIVHTTLVPGWTVGGDGRAGAPEGPSIAVENCPVRIAVARSILGPIHVRIDEHGHAPLAVAVTDSILDAGGTNREAFTSTELAAYVSLDIARSTVLGRLRVHMLRRAENSILTGTVAVLRRQHGCARFSYIPHGSTTPPTFRCVPNVAATDLPIFVSRRFGDPGYCLLAQICPPSIAEGADDRGEMGVFHDGFRPQREADLRRRLAEAIRAGDRYDLQFTI